MSRSEEAAADEAAIRALVERWARAVREKDYEGILADHSADMLMFDVPPASIEGTRGVQGDLGSLLLLEPESGVFDISEMSITAGSDVAFVAALMRFAGTAPNGVEEELAFRLTIRLRKLDGRWIVTHEHHSLPAT
jgi:uncharacterized protein (TIGR02246 family)